MAAVSDDWCQTVENINNILCCGLDEGTNWNKLLKELQTVERCMKDEQHRATASEVIFKNIERILNAGSYPDSPRLPEGSKNVQAIPVLTECFRCLRNACVNSPRNQKLIAEYDGILKETFCICQQFKCSLHNTDCALLLRCAIQFLGNFVVMNQEHQQKVWEGLKPVLRVFVQCSDEKLPHYTCMVLHTCLSGLTSGCSSDLGSFLTAEGDGKDLVLSVIDRLHELASEWILFVTEDFLSLDNFWSTVACDLTPDKKLLLLEIACRLLTNAEDSNQTSRGSCALAISNLKSVAHEFTHCATEILKLNEHSGSDVQVIEIMLKELEVLCLATSDPAKYVELRTDQQLLQTSVGLLQGVHSLGKEGNSVFSSVTKLRTASTVTSNQQVVGLKRDLIRLIGNMVYRNPDNQNLVRKLEGIPLILDHTSIDERNPFITQWSILAIRNLCEENPDNKSVIANLKMERLSEDVSALGDFGVKAEIRDDKVVVTTLPKKDDDDVS